MQRPYPEKPQDEEAPQIGAAGHSLGIRRRNDKSGAG